MSPDPSVYDDRLHTLFAAYQEQVETLAAEAFAAAVRPFLAAHHLVLQNMPGVGFIVRWTDQTPADFIAVHADPFYQPLDHWKMLDTETFPLEVRRTLCQRVPGFSANQLGDWMPAYPETDAVQT